MRGRQTQIRLAAIIIFVIGSSGLAFWASGGDAPGQPIAFSHQLHVEKKIDCTFCHQYANKSLAAGIPSVRLCMVCHQSIKADSPEIQKVRGFLDAKQEIPWNRVYGFPTHAHVYFNHRKHIAAGVDCAKCHGDVGKMTVAQPVVQHTMGWCIRCHKENRSTFHVPELATDCLTCHY